MPLSYENVPVFCPTLRIGLKIGLGVGIPCGIILSATAAFMIFRHVKQKRTLPEQHAAKPRGANTQATAGSDHLGPGLGRDFQKHVNGAEEGTAPFRQKQELDGAIVPPYPNELQGSNGLRAPEMA